MDEINVNVVKRKGLNLYLRYTDPVTGKRYEKNSGTKNVKKANKAAGELQAELSRGVDSHGKVVRWPASVTATRTNACATCGIHRPLP